jgi:hypothetical protein
VAERMPKARTAARDLRGTILLVWWIKSDQRGALVMCGLVVAIWLC